MKNPNPLIGGIGMFIATASCGVLLCGGHYIFAIPLLVGLGLIIFALFTRHMKFMR